jgi:hypothetical protein
MPAPAPPRILREPLFAPPAIHRKDESRGPYGGRRFTARDTLPGTRIEVLRMSLSQRSGVHPFDASLDQQWLLAWIVPSLQVLKRNVLVMAPVALGFGVYAWLLPKLLLTGIDSGSFSRIFDSLQVTTVVAAFMGVGYALLARSEGAPWGLGQLPPTAGIAQRLAVITLFWLIASALFGWLLQGVLGGLVKSPSFIEFGMWLFGKLGWWSIPFVLWLFSPIGFWLATVSALTQIRAVRGEEPVNEIVVDSFRRVFADPLRIAVPAYILTAAAIFVLYVFAELILEGLVGALVRLGSGAMIVFAAIGMALALPFWFVIERVYAPELGLEDDVEIGLDDAGETLPEPVVERVSLPEQLRRLLAEQGAPTATRQVADWVRARKGSPAELQALMQQLGQPELLARELSPLVVEWSPSSKPGELPWLVEQGMSLSPAFMMDAPGHVLALSKKLTMSERADLASRLLMSMLKQHRGHADHLPAGLQLARLLATHSNNVDGARKLLAQLARIYPEAAEVGQMLKQFGSAG